MAQEPLGERSEAAPGIPGALSCYDVRMIQDIVVRLESISKNTNSEPLHILGGYIVGATLARDDFENLSEKYPLLAVISELGADLETLENHQDAITVYNEFQRTLRQLERDINAL